MIFVEEKPEPLDFDTKVRVPGQTFLEKVPSPSTDQWKNRSYWQNILTELDDRYGGICAYTCHRIASDTGADTVDHFVPKSFNPALAYEWSNYRFVCARMNGRKGTKQDVLDPFGLRDRTFALHFPSLQVQPSEECGANLAAKAERTIKKLKLNDTLCVKARVAYVVNYCKAWISFEFLEENAPFIHREILRQGLVDSIGEVMSIDS